MELFNNWPYMKAWAEGNTTFVETGPAASVLPYRVKDGVVEVALIKQHRPEVGTTIVKTIGGYRKQTTGKHCYETVPGWGNFEHSTACVIRNARSKAGIEISGMDIHSLGEVSGYTIAKVRIQMLLARDWKEVSETEIQPGSELFVVSLDRACEMALRGVFSQDAVSLELVLRMFVQKSEIIGRWT